mmetsp:Transcript_14469/g.29252  ORF Transcript_14469/g.29252 Transcript_14469/m.29252 type:complete len:90 (+) Transcript_14469:838-1107(+)
MRLCSSSLNSKPVGAFAAVASDCSKSRVAEKLDTSPISAWIWFDTNPGLGFDTNASTADDRSARRAKDNFIVCLLQRWGTFEENGLMKR